MLPSSEYPRLGLLAVVFLVTAAALIGQSVRINEFSAYPSVVPDSPGAESNLGVESDWIELFNASGTDVNLAGWSLTDDADDLRQWVFPDVMIPAKGYLVVLALTDACGNVVSEFRPEYPPQAEDTSYGWDEESGTYQVFTTMTPGWHNGSAAFVGIPPSGPPISLGKPTWAAMKRITTP